MGEGSNAARDMSAACTSGSAIWRIRAVIQRPTTRTAVSVLALSFGKYRRTRQDHDAEMTREVIHRFVERRLAVTGLADERARVARYDQLR